MTDAAALYNAGCKRRPAWNAPEDPVAEAEGMALIEQAAELGHVPAMDLLASWARPDGERWLFATARLGHLSPLDSAMTNGDWPEDLPKRVLAAAHAGEPWAQLVVGRVYGLGMRNKHGVELATQDLAYGWLPGVADPLAESLRWHEAAAASGWPTAALYLAGKLLAHDDARALQFARQAVERASELPERSRTAARTLFLQLLDRTEAPMAERLEAYTAMAAGGDMDAQAWLGDRYRRGDGVPKDLAKARALYEPAADAGAVVACRELGKMLERGQGGPKDPDRARELYERAAELGADRYSRKRLAEAFGLTWYALGKDG